MNTTAAISNTTGGPIVAGDVELWVEQRGAGPDVLLLAGLSDPAEAWTFQLDGLSDRYRLTAFDSRGRSDPRRAAHGAARRGPPAFQESPDAFNVLVDAFWTKVDAVRR